MVIDLKQICLAYQRSIEHVQPEKHLRTRIFLQTLCFILQPHRYVLFSHLHRENCSETPRGLIKHAPSAASSLPRWGELSGDGCVCQEFGRGKELPNDSQGLHYSGSGEEQDVSADLQCSH